MCILSFNVKAIPPHELTDSMWHLSVSLDIELSDSYRHSYLVPQPSGMENQWRVCAEQLHMQTHGAATFSHSNQKPFFLPSLKKRNSLLHHSV